MTNAEKHQKIYELAGVEPRMWSGKSSGGDLVISDYYIVYDEHRIDLPNPYYPAEQLWEVLPEKIGVNIKMIFSTDIRYAASSLVKPLHYESYPDRTLLDALLDMVLWCIENGYIKKRGEE